MQDRKIYLELTVDEFIMVFCSVTDWARDMKKRLDNSSPEKDNFVLRGNYHLCQHLADKLHSTYKLEIEGFCDDE